MAALHPRKRSHPNAFGIKQLLCATAAIICSLPLSTAYTSNSIPPEHMRRDLGKILGKRQSNGTLSLVITNNCTEDIYPAFNTQHGSTPSETGFLLQSHNSHTVQVSTNWQGRIWGRTNCTFPNPNTGLKTCQTGDCVGELECKSSVRLNLLYQYQTNLAKRVSRRLLWQNSLPMEETEKPTTTFPL